jgi:hypothetical protein
MRHHQLLGSKQVTKNVYNLAVKYGTTEKELNHQSSSTLTKTEDLCFTCTLAVCKEGSNKCPIKILADEAKAKRKAAKEKEAKTLDKIQKIVIM